MDSRERIGGSKEGIFLIFSTISCYNLTYYEHSRQEKEMQMAASLYPGAHPVPVRQADAVRPASGTLSAQIFLDLAFW